MKIELINGNGIEIAHVISSEIIISDAQSALDLMMTVKYETGAKSIAISKKAISDRFFVLSSELAGEILQKFINYRFRVAIYGDYSKYNSKPLQDFIYESNRGKDIFFTDSLESAVKKLSVQ